MSGNLAGTYQSFLTRCLGGVRREQEAFRDLTDAQKQFKALEERGKALDLPEGWMVEGTEEPVESYRKGKEAFENEGDVYALLPPLKDLVRQREESLKRAEAEAATAWAAKAAKAAEDVEEARKRCNKAEAALQEAGNAVPVAEKEAKKAKKAKEDAEAQFKNEEEGRRGCGGVLLFVFLVCLLSAGIMIWHGGGGPAVAWLVFVPLALLIVFQLSKKVQEGDKKGMLKKLEEEAEKAAAILKQRKEESEAAQSALEEADSALAKAKSALEDAENAEAMLKQRQAEVEKVNLPALVANLLADMVLIPFSAAAPAEEKTEFTLELTAVGGNKIALIKKVCAITELGLKDAKELVEGAPKVLNLAKNEAEKIKKQLGAVGAQATISQLNGCHQVVSQKDFMLGKYEVTQAQWDAVMGENPSKFKGADNPVEMVCWNDCQVFLEKLNALPAVKNSGQVFRLPTEKEWEFACRAGATGEYCRLADGTEITENTLDQVAWFEDNSGKKPHPVGQKQSNAFGLYDMHGNVWEWTSSSLGLCRVIRGGSWFNAADECTSSLRPKFDPSYAGDCHGSFGFRLASSLSE